MGTTEKRNKEQSIGESFRQYKNKVPRWLGRSRRQCKPTAPLAGTRLGDARME